MFKVKTTFLSPLVNPGKRAASAPVTQRALLSSLMPCCELIGMQRGRFSFAHPDEWPHTQRGQHDLDTNIHLLI